MRALIVFIFIYITFHCPVSSATLLIDPVLECRNSLLKLIEDQDYEAYEKKLKICVDLAKDYDKKNDFLAQTLYLDLNTQDAWQDPQRQKSLLKYFLKTYTLNFSKMIMGKQTSQTLKYSYEFSIYFSTRWLQEIDPKYNRLLFNTLEEREYLNDKIIEQYYYFNIAHRLFLRAQNLRNKYTHIDLPIIPKIKNDSNYSKFSPGFMEFNSHNLLIKKNFELNNGSKVVMLVSPYCPYTLKALKAINHDAGLLKVFNTNGLFLAPQIISSFEAIKSYNIENPNTQFVMSAKDSLWKPIRDLGEGFPIFYFLKDGKIHHKIIGFGKKFKKMMNISLKKIELGND